MEDIKFASLADHLSAKILGDKSVVSITLQGISSVLDEINADDYSAYVDCEGLHKGKYRLKVHLDLGDSSAIVKTEFVTVKIDRDDGGSDTSNGSTEATEKPKATPAPSASDGSSQDEGDKE